MPPVANGVDVDAVPPVDKTPPVLERLPPELDAPPKVVESVEVVPPVAMGLMGLELVVVLDVVPPWADAPPLLRVPPVSFEAPPLVSPAEPPVASTASGSLRTALQPASTPKRPMIEKCFMVKALLKLAKDGDACVLGAKRGGYFDAVFCGARARFAVRGS